MRINDIISIAQANLVRAKLRTFLTVGAVFIGVLTISLTNGVGNGIRAYVNDQLGNVGVEHTLFVQAKQSQQNPVATDVTVYDPNRKIGNFNVALLGVDDAARIQGLAGVQKVTPLRDPHIEYITAGGEKYQATATQYIEGLNIKMAAGKTIQPGQVYSITIPIRYVEPLGLGSPEKAVGQTVTLAYKDITGVLQQRQVTIAGVQEQSLIGGADNNISAELSREIYDSQTRGVSGFADRYMGVLVHHDPSLTTEEVDALKKKLGDMNYNARTIKEQIGIISQVIDGILLVLNVFGVIALIAATFGIVNTLFMAVNERTSEIGLMKALGANRRAIFSIFAVEAASIGFWGGLLGILASMGIGVIVNRVVTHTFLKNLVGLKLLAFPILPSIGILIGVIVLAFLAGALPALKASKLDPIKALRYE
jgi:putative ABC transport system permease protein